MRKEQLFVSTMADDAGQTARKYGLGVEIAEYCTAWNMDRELLATKEAVAEEIEGVDRLTLHGPFNEVSPAAIDPLVLDITKKRYGQAVALALEYGAHKVIIHSGFSSDWYFTEWYKECAIGFWKEFLAEHPGDYTIVFENVLETDPSMILDIVRAVDDARFKLCVDIGHANASIGYGKKMGVNRIGEPANLCPDVYSWLHDCAPYISHLHIHNNFGDYDTHNALWDGTIDMKRLLMQVENECDENVTYTLEVHDSDANVNWLMEEGLLYD